MLDWRVERLREREGILWEVVVEVEVQVEIPIAVLMY